MSIFFHTDVQAKTFTFTLSLETKLNFHTDVQAKTAVFFQMDTDIIGSLSQVNTLFAINGD